MFTRNQIPNNLRITNKVIIHNNQAWQVQNITRVGKYIIKKSNPLKVKIVFMNIGILLIGLLMANEGIAFGIFLFCGAVLYLVFKLFKKIFQKSKYALKIETSSGSSELFTSHDESFIDRLVVEITEVIQNQSLMQEVRKELTVNIDRRTIYDNIHNSTIIRDSEVNNSFNNRFKILD